MSRRPASGRATGFVVNPNLILINFATTTKSSLVNLALKQAELRQVFMGVDQLLSIVFPAALNGTHPAAQRGMNGVCPCGNRKRIKNQLHSPRFGEISDLNWWLWNHSKR
jgi:hypothetical protein